MSRSNTVKQATRQYPHENDAYWVEIYSDFKNSNKSRNAYCKAQGINYDRFGYWLSVTATPDCADAMCMHFSFIRTAKAHGLDPYHYYVAVLKQLPHCQTVDDYEKLLPWNILSYYQLVH